MLSALAQPLSSASHQLLEQKEKMQHIAPCYNRGVKWRRRSDGKGWFAPSSCWLCVVEVTEMLHACIFHAKLLGVLFGFGCYYSIIEKCASRFDFLPVFP